MAKCTIYIHVTGQQEDKVISVEMETTPGNVFTQDEIKVFVANEDARDKLVEQLKGTLLKYDYKDIDSSTLVDLNGLLGNCTLEYLKQLFPEILFGEIDNVPILLVNNLTVYGNPVYGRIVKANGEELFILRNDEKDILLFVNFLNLRTTILSDTYDFEGKLTNELKKALENIKKLRNAKNAETEVSYIKRNIDNLRELVIDYIYNKNAYLDIYTKNPLTKKMESAYVTMENIAKMVQEQEIRLRFDDDFVNDINHRLLFKDKECSVTEEGFLISLKLHYPEIYNALCNLEGEQKNPDKYLHNLLRMKFSKVSNLFKDNILATFGDLFINFDLNLESYNNKTVISILTDFLFSLEEDFNYLFTGFQDRPKAAFRFKRTFPTIEEKLKDYNFGYQSILGMEEVEIYKGYKIYHFVSGKQDFYIPSKRYINLRSTVSIYKTKETARNAINKRIKNQIIRKSSNIEFYKLPDEKNLIKSLSYIENKSMIDLLNILIDSLILLSADDDALLNLILSGTNDEKDFIFVLKNLWKYEDKLKRLINIINTPEKAALLVYKANELAKKAGNLDIKTEQIINNALDEIEEADKSSVQRNTIFVEKLSSGYYKDLSQYTYRVIRDIKPIDILNYKKDVRTEKPMATFFEAILKVLKDKIGIEMEILTANEILLKHKDNPAEFPLIDVNETKAFILGNKIYINISLAQTSDLFHEYTHLILGVLKLKDFDAYQNLINEVSLNTNEGRQEFIKLRRLYGLERPFYDIEEEVCAKLFGNWISMNMSKDLDNIFVANKKIKQSINELFTRPVNDIKKEGKHTIKSVFLKFNHLVGILLQDSKTLNFSDTLDYRKSTNWIAKQIKDGQITEKCYES